MEEADKGLLAVKGAIHDFVSSSCTSGKKGTGAGRGFEPCPAPRNQSSSREGSGLGGLLTSSPMLTAARASMAVSSGSGAAVATTPEGGSPTAPSSSKDVSPSPDAAIDILSTDGTPNEMLGAPWDRPAKSPGNRTGCSICYFQKTNTDMHVYRADVTFLIPLQDMDFFFFCIIILCCIIVFYVISVSKGSNKYNSNIYKEFVILCCEINKCIG